MFGGRLRVIALVPCAAKDGTDFDSLLKNADVALYRAKCEGRGKGQVYTLGLHAAAMARLEAEGDLRRAPERGELFLEYPPARESTVDKGPDGAGLQGALEVFGPPVLLQICHLGRLSGALEATHEATHEARTIRMTFETGRLTAAASLQAQGRDAVMEFLAWTQGRFAFHAGADAQGEPTSEPLEFLILEACRLLDEKSAVRVGN